MIDPLNRSSLDGAACGLCGDDATGIDVIANDRIPTCGPCHSDRVFTCVDCGLLFLSETGYRLSNTPDLHCSSCASRYPELIIGREMESRADVARDDDFNRSRR